jgi:hypothetical protein
MKALPTPEQAQLLEEMGALVKAWVDRGVLVRDVVPLFATYLVTTAIQAGYPVSVLMELIPRLWARTMLAVVEDKAKAPIPELSK